MEGRARSEDDDGASGELGSPPTIFRSALLLITVDTSGDCSLPQDATLRVLNLGKIGRMAELLGTEVAQFLYEATSHVELNSVLSVKYLEC